MANKTHLRKTVFNSSQWSTASDSGIWQQEHKCDSSGRAGSTTPKHVSTGALLVVHTLRPTHTHLRDVKQPKQVGRGGVLGVEGGAGEDGVSVAVRDHEGLDAHVRAQDNLHRVEWGAEVQESRAFGECNSTSTMEQRVFSKVRGLPRGESAFPLVFNQKKSHEIHLQPHGAGRPCICYLLREDKRVHQNSSTI